MTEAYVRQLARVAHFWSWPMVNIHNRLTAFSALPAPGLMGGAVPAAPPNSIAMLHDYITPEERLVACPNQDVVYGFGPLHPGAEPAVVQVPDFGDRFWVYQLCDQRTDSFAHLGAMYDTKPGNYLVVRADWNGKVPDGITEVLRCPTAVGTCIPRCFMDDTDDDHAAILPLVNQIAVYPLSEYTGTPRTVDWQQAPVYEGGGPAGGDAEARWVFPDRLAEVLSTVLDEVPPLPGEEALYAQFRAVLAAIDADEDLRAAFTAAAIEAETELVQPLFQFRNYGVTLPHHWTTIINNAEWGTDYLTRTAAAKSNIFVNAPMETRYFYADLDADGQRLNGANNYTVTFSPGALPPVHGFWSLTVYNEHHFFHPNDLHRYSLGTKNKNLVTGADGSLTLYAQSEPPEDHQRANWLPTPAVDFTLYLRAYWPDTPIADGTWTPPPISRT
jgi:hypothetical protein